MPAKTAPKRNNLRLVVLNDSAPVLKMLCRWLEQHGHHCTTAVIADMRHAHEEVARCRWPREYASAAPRRSASSTHHAFTALPKTRTIAGVRPGLPRVTAWPPCDAAPERAMRTPSNSSSTHSTDS